MNELRSLFQDAFKAGQKFIENISKKRCNLDYSDMLANFTCEFNNSVNNKLMDTPYEKYSDSQNLTKVPQITQNFPDLKNYKSGNRNTSSSRKIVENNERLTNTCQTNVSFYDFAKSYERFRLERKCSTDKDGEYVKNHVKIGRSSRIDSTAPQNEDIPSASRTSSHFLHSFIKFIMHSTNFAVSLQNAAENSMSFGKIIQYSLFRYIFGIFLSG